MTINILEMQLTAVCTDTDNPEKCLAGISQLHILMMGAQGQEAEDIMTVVNLLHSKGNLFILESRGEL